MVFKQLGPYKLGKEPCVDGVVYTHAFEMQEIPTPEFSAAFDAWLQANTTGAYYDHFGIVAFTTPNDALVFKMRWI